MAYIVRSSSENFFIDTPIIGLPNNILVVSIDEYPRYSGPYILQNPEAPRHQQRWTNPYNGLYVKTLGFYSPMVFVLTDPLYEQAKYESGGFYSILYQPYLADSGEGSNFSEWAWSKNVLTSPATLPPGYIGLTEMSGELPVSVNEQVNVPIRTVSNIAGQRFLTLSKV